MRYRLKKISSFYFYFSSAFDILNSKARIPVVEPAVQLGCAVLGVLHIA
jgi:hypothetical protein